GPDAVRGPNGTGWPPALGEVMKTGETTGPTGWATTAAAAGAAAAAAARAPETFQALDRWACTERLRLPWPWPDPGQPLNATTALASANTHRPPPTMEPVVP